MIYRSNIEVRTTQMSGTNKSSRNAVPIMASKVMPYCSMNSNMEANLGI